MKTLAVCSALVLLAAQDPVEVKTSDGASPQVRMSFTGGAATTAIYVQRSRLRFDKAAGSEGYFNLTGALSANEGDVRYSGGFLRYRDAGGELVLVTETSTQTLTNKTWNGNTIAIAYGGTNATSVGSAGSVAYSTGTAYAFSAVGTSGQAMISGGAGAPTWFAPTEGSVLFAGTSGVLAQNNANFFWDNSNAQLGLGTSSPSTRFHSVGNNLDTEATGSVGAGLFAVSVTKNDANVRTFSGVKIAPTLNTGASNTTTTFNVLEIDTTNTSMTGLTTNLLKLSYGGTQRFLIDSLGNQTIDGTVTYNNDVTFTANVTLGNASTDTVTFTSQVNSAVTPSSDNVYDLGTSGNRWRTGYYSTSVTIGTNPAASGALRLANAGWITARNAANSGDVNVLQLDSGNLPHFGTASIVLDPGNDVTITAANPAAARTYTLANVGANADFVMTQGAQIINGAKTFAGTEWSSSPLKLTGNGGAVVGPTITMDATAGTGGRTFSLISTASGAAAGAGKLGVWDDTAGAYRLVLQADGTLSVGTTTDSAYLLDVQGGDFNVSGNLYTGGTQRISSGGTVTNATWNGTAVAANYGGTGQTSYTVGDLLYASGATTLSKLADVATGNALISGGVGVAPSWGKIGLTTHVSGTLGISNGGTNSTTYTSNQFLWYNGTSIVASGYSNTSFVGGSGTTDYVPLWTASQTLGNSRLFQNANSMYISSVATETPAFSVYCPTTSDKWAIVASSSGGSTTAGTGWGYGSASGGGIMGLAESGGNYKAGVQGIAYTTTPSPVAGVVGSNTANSAIGGLSYKDTAGTWWSGYFSGANALVNGGNLRIATTSGQTPFEIGSYNNSDSLWLMSGNSTKSEVHFSTNYNLNYDYSIAIQYTPGTIGGQAGALLIGQLSKNNANFTHGVTRLYTNGTERLRITNDGTVLIGTTADDNTLLRIGSTTGDGLQIGSAEEITDAGFDDAEINFDLLPTADNAWDLGRSTLAWNQVYSYGYPAPSMRKFKKDVVELDRKELAHYGRIVRQLPSIRYRYNQEFATKAELNAAGFVTKEEAVEGGSRKGVAHLRKAPRLGTLADCLPPEAMDESGTHVELVSYCGLLLAALKDLQLEVDGLRAEVAEWKRK